MSLFFKKIAAGKDFAQKHPEYMSGFYFVLGVLVDIFTLSRIDQVSGIVQQGLYLLLIGFILWFEFLNQMDRVQVSSKYQKWVDKFWKYREGLLHFFLGSLLSAYTIFYFKSSSFIASFVFLAILGGLLVANETKSFRGMGLSIRFATYALLLTSYFAYLVPVFWGSVGFIPFFFSILLSVLFLWMADRWMVPRFNFVAEQKSALYRQIYYPWAGVLALFLTLYLAQILPPVPISIQYMGIYHSLEKQEGKYKLGYTRSPWMFWQAGDQTFQAEAGDTLYIFSRIFSPTHFVDKVRYHFLQRDEKRGWVTQDKIPIEIVGGRDEGFRAFVRKTNYSSGFWQVRLETMDNREIGRISFEIVRADVDQDRQKRFDFF